MTSDHPPGTYPDPALARPPLATIPLRPFRRLPWLLIILLAAAAAVFTLVVTETRTPIAAIGAVYAALGFLTVLAFRRRRLSERPPIVVTTDAVVLPAGALTARTRTVALEDVTSIEERGSAQRRLLIIGTRQKPLILPRAALVHADGVERLRHAVRTAIMARPDGLTRVAEMADREAAGRSAGRRPPRATMSLLAAVGVVFVIELATGALGDRTMLLRLGANSPILVRAGQWWRPFTANLLHLRSCTCTSTPARSSRSARWSSARSGRHASSSRRSRPVWPVPDDGVRRPPADGVGRRIRDRVRPHGRCRS
jgi:membrane associated rhomboid family serine protease